MLKPCLKTFEVKHAQETLKLPKEKAKSNSLQETLQITEAVTRKV